MNFKATLLLVCGAQALALAPATARPERFRSPRAVEKAKQAEPPAGESQAATLLSLLHAQNVRAAETGLLTRTAGGSAAVRDLGEQVVVEHRAADDEVLSIAGRLGLSLPRAELSKDDEADARDLKLRKGAAFDRRFLQARIREDTLFLARLQKARSVLQKDGTLLDGLEAMAGRQLRSSQTLLRGLWPQARRAR